MRRFLLNVSLSLGILGFAQNGFATDLSQYPNFDIKEYQGKIVYLEFWATWCGTCRTTLPWLSELQAKFKDKPVKVVAVSLDNDLDYAGEFVKKLRAKGLQFDVVYDLQGQTGANYGLVGVPSALLIGKKGEVLAKHHGFNAKMQKQVEADIVEALAKP